ncbi:DUF2007 domain-containing protein [bacterium]|jgi:hypothetical protein|nr:DUF2007 domain-containing protein [bacterium]
MDDFAQVSVYYSISAAELAVSALEAEGIKCYLSDYNTFSIGALCDPDIGWIKLMVNGRDLKRAKEILGVAAG